MAKDLPADPQYGLPKLKKYPLFDEKHVKSAVIYFNKVNKENEKELADAILAKAKEFGMTLNATEKNKFRKYLCPEGYTVIEYNDEIYLVTDQYNSDILVERAMFNLSYDSLKEFAKVVEGYDSDEDDGNGSVFNKFGIDLGYGHRECLTSQYKYRHGEETLSSGFLETIIKLREKGYGNPKIGIIVDFKEEYDECPQKIGDEFIMDENEEEYLPVLRFFLTWKDLNGFLITGKYYIDFFDVLTDISDIEYITTTEEAQTIFSEIRSEVLADPTAWKSSDFFNNEEQDIPVSYGEK